ncbi:MAG: enoyl-CoA hydratase-related protein [Gammaproteobacteria bacterium]
MNFTTLLVSDIPHGIRITLNRLEQRNSINTTLLTELNQVLDAADKNPDWCIIVLSGQSGIFCTGMDFSEVSHSASYQTDDLISASSYMNTLKRFATMSKVIVAEVDGQVMAGGVGLVAASDIVIATTRSHFTLSEALWGLLPANVLPYLIRRVGFQKAYWMTLTTQTLSATDAHAIHLVDELSDQADVLRKLIMRLARLDEQTITDMKKYFQKLWFINETMEQVAISELERLMAEPRVRHNITRFMQEGKFPWEKV